MSDGRADEVATLVVRHRVKKGSRDLYEEWLRTTIAAAKRYEGHLGIDVQPSQRGGLPLYTSVLRFSCAEKLQNPSVIIKMSGGHSGVPVFLFERRVAL